MSQGVHTSDMRRSKTFIHDREPTWLFEKGFSEDRVRAGAARLEKNLKSNQQSRLEGFFKPIPKTEAEQKAHKRKLEEQNEAKKKKLKEEKKEKAKLKAKPRGAA